MINSSNTLSFELGLMGAGIVQVAAAAGRSVVMVDISNAALEKGTKIITSSLARIAKKQYPDNSSQQESYVDEIMGRVKVSTEKESSASNADLIIEAIVEDLKTKQSLFKTLDESAPSHTIFTSNTSSLPISSIAKSTSQKRQSQFAGLHFFNPVPQMKLVEIVKSEQTLENVIKELSQFVKDLGKVGVLCKDTPGYVILFLLFYFSFSLKGSFIFLFAKNGFNIWIYSFFFSFNMVYIIML